MALPNPYGRSPGVHRKSQRWRALKLFFFYRVALVSVLGLGFFTRLGPGLLGSSSPQLFTVGTFVYLGFVLSSGLFLWRRSPSADQQIRYTLIVDILAITVLMHASGGITSGLGLLIAVSIANASLLMGGRLALSFAALATLIVLTEQLYAHITDAFPKTAYTQGGMLGVTFFAVALLAHVSSLRLKESESLVRQRGLDLAKMAKLNEYVIQHMGTGVLVADRSDAVLLANETARHLLDVAEIRSGESLSTIQPELAARLETWRGQARQRKRPVHIQLGARDLQVEIVPFGPRPNAGTLIFLEDISRLKEQAQQMKLASLGRLTASIAHEIRNPLGAISHAGQLLAESPDLGSGDRRLTEIIKGNSTRVNDIIETVMQLSRRDRARPEFINLQAWTQRFVDEYCQSRMVDPGTFGVDISPPGLSVPLDPRQLQQVLSNLCDNALKYAQQTDRELVIRFSGGMTEGTSEPLLDVIDNGPGIEPNLVRQIFEPFFTTSTKGVGLGLYIAKELCDINRIDLSYTAIPEGGSRFRLGFRDWKLVDLKS